VPEKVFERYIAAAAHQVVSAQACCDCKEVWKGGLEMRLAFLKARTTDSAKRHFAERPIRSRRKSGFNGAWYWHAPVAGNTESAEADIEGGQDGQ
jgi:hypothetical protein